MNVYKNSSGNIFSDVGACQRAKNKFIDGNVRQYAGYGLLFRFLA